MKDDASSAHMPTPKQQSWGAFISIIVIVLMIVIGAYYAWSERMARYEQYGGASTEQQ
jgi:NADH:ubiquinone oxidoreductase subunit 3 (subunit A)